MFRIYKLPSDWHTHAFNEAQAHLSELRPKDNIII